MYSWQLLNQIVCELPPEHPLSTVRPLRDSLGHTPLQVCRVFYWRILSILAEISRSDSLVTLVHVDFFGWTGCCWGSIRLLHCDFDEDIQLGCYLCNTCTMPESVVALHYVKRMWLKEQNGPVKRVDCSTLVFGDIAYCLLDIATCTHQWTSLLL